MNSHKLRNRYFFGLGTIGRDMFYTMMSMFFMVYLTEVLNLSDNMLWWVGIFLMVLRIFDALNDPIMGLIVDNTNTKWGKFKPWILIGGVSSAIFFVLLFTDLGLSSDANLVIYLIVFTLLYLAWDVTYGLNDIAYWSMLPALTLDQKEREKIGSLARIFANIGLFIVVVLILPVTDWMTGFLGSAKTSWFLLAVIFSVLMIGFLMFTLFGVKEMRGNFKQEEKTTLRGMLKALLKNDQLLFTTISMALFMIGYTTTATFGAYFFKYAFKDEGMYSVFAAILGVSQLLALSVFPLFSKRFTRKQLYFASTVLVIAGYVLFFFAPMDMAFIGPAGVLIFAGQAFIEVLILMFLADTIEYGQWKSGKRNQAITLSVQPLINKIGGAIATGIVTVTLIISGINSANTPNDVTNEGLLMLKIAMLLIPLLCIVAGYIVYRAKYRIDKKFYDQIVADIAARGDITEVK